MQRQYKITPKKKKGGKAWVAAFYYLLNRDPIFLNKFEPQSQPQIPTPNQKVEEGGLLSHSSINQLAEEDILLFEKYLAEGEIKKIREVIVNKTLLYLWYSKMPVSVISNNKVIPTSISEYKSLQHIFNIYLLSIENNFQELFSILNDAFPDFREYFKNNLSTISTRDFFVFFVNLLNMAQFILPQKMLLHPRFHQIHNSLQRLTDFNKSKLRSWHEICKSKQEPYIQELLYYAILKGGNKRKKSINMYIDTFDNYPQGKEILEEVYKLLMDAPSNQTRNKVLSRIESKFGKINHQSSNVQSAISSNNDKEATQENGFDVGDFIVTGYVPPITQPIAPKYTEHTPRFFRPDNNLQPPITSDSHLKHQENNKQITLSHTQYFQHDLIKEKTSQEKVFNQSEVRKFTPLSFKKTPMFFDSRAEEPQSNKHSEYDLGTWYVNKKHKKQ